MRMRPEGPDGDYQIGVAFLQDSPELTRQLVTARLQLWQGEWFADTSDGTPYQTEVLGERYNKHPDAALRTRILGTQSVQSILEYTSELVAPRQWNVRALVQSEFSKTPVPIVTTVGGN